MDVCLAFASGHWSLPVLAPLRVAVVVTHGMRGCRFAQPPATGWHPSGMNGDGGCGRGRPRSRRCGAADGRWRGSGIGVRLSSRTGSGGVASLNPRRQAGIPLGCAGGHGAGNHERHERHESTGVWFSCVSCVSWITKPPARWCRGCKSGVGRWGGVASLSPRL
jgi:hypothetical protein